MGHEAHLNIFQKVFADRFLYTTVAKWTHKNKNVFVYVKCIYVAVGLICELTCQLEYCSTLFYVPIARGFDHHHDILPKMPSTIFLHVIT